MTTGIVSGKTNDIWIALQRKFEAQYNYPEFWDYVLSAIIKNPPLGEPAYQKTYVYNLFKEWADKVNKGQLKPPSGTPVAPTAAPTTPTSVEEHPPKVESINGYDFLMEWDDLNKRYAIHDLLGKTSDPQSEQRAQQAEQAAQATEWGLRQDAINAAQWQARGEAMTAAQLRASQALQGWQAGNIQASNAAQQASMAAEFDKWRATILSSLAPRDWVIREKAKVAVNPFETKPVVIADAVSEMNDQLKTAQAREANARASLTALGKRVSDDYDFVDKFELDAANERLALAKQGVENITGRLNELKTIAAGGKGTGYWGTDIDVREELAYAEPKPTGTGGWTVGKPTVTEPVKKPEIPEEIQPYLTSPEFGAEVATPSAAQWVSMPWTAQEKLIGYFESLGGSEADLLGKIEAGRPSMPSLGTTSWAPRR